MTFTPFTTVEQALQACEEARLEPLTGFDYPDGKRYSVCLDGQHYQTYFGERQFLGWCNAHFRMVDLRRAAGWSLTKPWGWLAPDGTTEEEWIENHWPLPEDPEYDEWIQSAHQFDDPPFRDFSASSLGL